MKKSSAPIRSIALAFICGLLGIILNARLHAKEVLPLVGELSGESSFSNYLDARFEGAFTVYHQDDVSLSTYSKGRVAYNPQRHSVYLDSAVRDCAIAEYSIPKKLGKNPENLPNGKVLQGFFKPFEATVTGNEQALDNIGALAYVEGELWVQAYRYYDAGGRRTHTTAIIRNPENFKQSKVDGFYSMQGGARTVSYIAPIPESWQEALKGRYLAGQGLGMPINSRNSIGPSLYSFNPERVKASQGSIKTQTWIAYESLDQGLSTHLYQFQDENGLWDNYNQVGQKSGFKKGQNNDLWTQISAARFGFIIPGTRTFAVIGSSGMHQSGGAYKAKQSNGNQCGGPCAYDPSDQYVYYWLYDMQTVLAAESPHKPVPYEYGELEGARVWGYPTAGAFDLGSGKLWIAYSDDLDGGTKSPVIALYQLGYRSN